MLKVAGFEDQLIMTIHVVQGKGSGVTLNKIERLMCVHLNRLSVWDSYQTGLVSITITEFTNLVH